jgi:polysaccharide biosynthesis/export protein
LFGGSLVFHQTRMPERRGPICRRRHMRFVTISQRRPTLVDPPRCTDSATVCPLNICAGESKLRASSRIGKFVTFPMARLCRVPPVDSTFQVLFLLTPDITFHANSSNARADCSPLSDGESTEMSEPVKTVLGAVGLLILQLAVVASAQQTSSSAASVLGASASPPGKSAVESSQSPAPGNSTRSAEGTATQSDKADGPGDPAFGGERHPLYRLTKSDVVDVNFTFSPDYNQSLTVQPDGFVVLKGAGPVLAEGLTLPQLQQKIAGAYRGVLHEPEVTLSLKDFDKPYFLASGEVTKPGKYELRGDVTVNEAIAIAGGFTQQARHSQVVVFRRVSSEVAETHVLDVKRMLYSRDLREDLHLRPGDFIYVPQNRMSKVRKFVPTNSLSWYMNPLQF